MIDPEMAPPGKHVMSCFVMYTPHELKGASWPAHREAMADRVQATLRRFFPGFDDLVLQREVVTPDIIEERTVGPSLGSDSIRAGLIASVIGLVGVVQIRDFGFDGGAHGHHVAAVEQRQGAVERNAEHVVLGLERPELVPVLDVGSEPSEVGGDGLPVVRMHAHGARQREQLQRRLEGDRVLILERVAADWRALSAWR